MSIQRSARPEHNVTLPVSKKKVKFQNFNMRTESMMMLAITSENTDQVINGFNNIIHDCLTAGDIVVEELCSAEAEFLVLNMRAKSVQETVELSVIDPNDPKKSYKHKLDLRDVKVDIPEGRQDIIKLNEETVVKFRLPTMFDNEQPKGSTQQEKMMGLASLLVKQIVIGDECYNANEVSQEEIYEFIENLSISEFQNILQNFLLKIPSLTTTMTIKRNDGTEFDQVVSGLISFLPDFVQASYFKSV